MAIEPIAKDMQKEVPISGGWIMGLYNEIIKNPKYELSICFPNKSKEVIEGRCGNVNYYSFYQHYKMFGLLADTLCKSSITKRHMKYIMEVVKPDILYVFGTEYSHSLLAVEAFGCSERTVVNIQGMTSAYYYYYYADLPLRVINKFAISNIVRGSIRKQKEITRMRGDNEILAIKKASHAVGRTDWDHAHVKHINQDIKYHICNESLRDVFYNPPRLWNYNDCVKHTIFMSQGSYPIKGLHYLLWALPIIINAFPDVHVYISGPDPVKRSGNFKDWIAVSSYGLYLRELIRKYGIESHITFLGKLPQDQMVEQYLKTNVYLLSSSIENSPNSLGEAMILGVPCVSSDVGGVKTMLTHNKEGLLYQHNEVDMLADCVIRIFNMKDKAADLGNAARCHALDTHDRVRNCIAVLELYDNVFNKISKHE